MKRSRIQRGHIFEKNGYWCLRYRDDVIENGAVVRRLLLHRLAPKCQDYPTEGSVRPLADAFLLPLNSGSVSPESTMTLERFVEDVYLPFVMAERRASTYSGYRNLWNAVLLPLCGNFRLRQFRTCDGERLLRNVARHHDYSRPTLKHTKSLLSGIFKQAKRVGALDGVNPMQDVSVPQAREGKETCAYSLEEIWAILEIAPPRLKPLVAVLSFTACRHGEVRGLRWEGYDGKTLAVSQAAWRNTIDDPKTRRSKSVIPVIPLLREALDAWRLECGNPRDGYIFSGPRGTPRYIDNDITRVLKPLLKKAEIRWGGCHAFRRGMATNLNKLGVPAKVIQAILRHSDLSTTMNIYVKTDLQQATESLGRLQVAFTNCSPARSSRNASSVVN